MYQKDTVDSDEDENIKVDELKEKIGKLEEEKQRHKQVQNPMKATGQKEISIADPDSRLMRVDSQRLDVCYHIQTSVDMKQHLIVDYVVINNSIDHHQLAKDAKEAKQVLAIPSFEVVAEKGFYIVKDVKYCEDDGITVFMPIPSFDPNKNAGVPEPEFCSDRFLY